MLEYNIETDLTVVILDCQAPDANEKKGVIPVCLHRSIGPGIGKKELIALLRSMLITLLVHEIDESIVYDGQKIFDPHRNEN